MALVVMVKRWLTLRWPWKVERLERLVLSMLLVEMPRRNWMLWNSRYQNWVICLMMMTRQIARQRYSKIKNTMGDHAAAEKAFNHKLEQFRAEILPEIVENWKSLSDVEQSQMIRANRFYCNLHALIGFADYSDGALKSLEQKWRRDIYGKLGVETLREFQNKAGEYSWSHSDSAVQRLIRTTCSAMCPGGDQMSGCAGHFLTYRREILNKHHLEIRVFRANKFNILF